MAFNKGYKLHFISLLIILSTFSAFCNFALIAAVIEEESAISPEGGAAKSATQEEDKDSAEVNSQAGVSINSTRIFTHSSPTDPSRTILLGGANKKKTKIKNPPPKANSSVQEEGMVDVDGEEFIEVESPPNEAELFQYSGPGQSMPEHSSPIGEGGSSGEAVSASLDFLTSSDTSQQQGTNDANPQILADWFLATLRDNPLPQIQVPTLKLENYYQTSHTLPVR